MASTSGKAKRSRGVNERELRPYLEDMVIPFRDKGAATSQRASLHRTRVRAGEQGYTGLWDRQLKVREARPEEAQYGPGTWVIESSNARESWEQALQAAEDLKKRQERMKKVQSRSMEGEDKFSIGAGEEVIAPGDMRKVEAKRDALFKGAK